MAREVAELDSRCGSAGKPATDNAPTHRGSPPEACFYNCPLFAAATETSGRERQLRDWSTMRRGCCKLSRRGRQLVSLVSRGRFRGRFRGDVAAPTRGATFADSAATIPRRWIEGTRKPRGRGSEHVAGGGIAWFGESIARCWRKKQPFPAALSSHGAIEDRSTWRKRPVGEETARGLARGLARGAGEEEERRGGKGGAAGWRR